MKKLFKPLILLLFAGAVASCSKSDKGFAEVEPEIINPLVNYEIIKGDDPFSFEFKNLSTKYTKLEWRFGDDTLSTEVSPKHVYLRTGKFQVDLKAFSETGAVTRKMVDINIDPDSVLQVSAAKTGVLNQVKFALQTKAQIASVLWTFKDSSPAATATGLTPTKNLAAGAFVNFTVKVTTTKGSVVTLDKFVTAEGVADNITRKGIYSVPRDNTNANENAAKFIDNDLNTKFLIGDLPVVVNFAYESPQTIKLYAVGQANDAHERDPMVWKFEGSNNQQTWEVVSSVTRTQSFKEEMEAQGKTGDARYKNLFYYAIANPKPFLYYRWTVTALKSGTTFQASEFRVYR
ncbi:PKD domain-containing protein [Pedobacter frigoris]|uniref:PKD domain-containing protein n=1 Tax=Pedobacter frigoris TaxID=2571272 RepID=UPI00292D1985|nr:PKD domain-containing protein [Pedobacter frigoris]